MSATLQFKGRAIAITSSTTHAQLHQQVSTFDATLKGAAIELKLVQIGQNSAAGIVFVVSPTSSDKVANVPMDGKRYLVVARKAGGTGY